MNKSALFLLVFLFGNVCVSIVRTASCTMRPTRNPSNYQEFVIGYGWILRSCAAGTAFSVRTCQCSLYLSQVTKPRLPPLRRPNSQPKPLSTRDISRESSKERSNEFVPYRYRTNLQGRRLMASFERFFEVLLAAYLRSRGLHIMSDPVPSAHSSLVRSRENDIKDSATESVSAEKKDRDEKRDDQKDDEREDKRDDHKDDKRDDKRDDHKDDKRDDKRDDHKDDKRDDKRDDHKDDKRDDRRDDQKDDKREDKRDEMSVADNDHREDNLDKIEDKLDGRFDLAQSGRQGIERHLKLPIDDPYDPMDVDPTNTREAVSNEKPSTDYEEFASLASLMSGVGRQRERPDRNFRSALQNPTSLLLRRLLSGM